MRKDAAALGGCDAGTVEKNSPNPSSAAAADGAFAALKPPLNVFELPPLLSAGGPPPNISSNGSIGGVYWKGAVGAVLMLLRTLIVLCRLCSSNNEKGVADVTCMFGVNALNMLSLVDV